MYIVEELFDKCIVAVGAIDLVDESDKSTMVCIASEYLTKLGEAIGITASKQ